MSQDKAAMLLALGNPFPQSALKTRVGGGNSRFTYVEGFTVIHRLNDATGGAWDWTIKSFEFRPLPPDRNGKEQSLVVVTGELTIPGLGTRAGIGVQKVSENGGEDLVKGASTDALKKAATLFGVALELYGPDYEAGESATPTRDQSRRSGTSSQTSTGPAAAPVAAGPPYTQAEYERVIDAAWQMAEDGETLDAIKGHINEHWARIPKPNRPATVAAVDAIARKWYAPASAAG